MPKSYGGQMRTTQCLHCDWICRKQLQEANKAYQRHLRLVHQEKAEIIPFNDVNGRDGMTTTRWYKNSLIILQYKGGLLT